jgi:hypothetical protein
MVIFKSKKKILAAPSYPNAAAFWRTHCSIERNSDSALYLLSILEFNH